LIKNEPRVLIKYCSYKKVYYFLGSKLIWEMPSLPMTVLFQHQKFEKMFDSRSTCKMRPLVVSKVFQIEDNFAPFPPKTVENIS